MHVSRSENQGYYKELYHKPNCLTDDNFINCTDMKYF
jgi:hypothetical protein